MEVEVKYRLLRMRSARIQHVHSCGPKVCPHGLGETPHEKHCGYEVLVTYVEEIDGVSERRDEGVTGSQHSTIRQKCDRPLRPVDYNGGSVSGDNLTKYAWHSSTMPLLLVARFQIAGAGA